MSALQGTKTMEEAARFVGCSAPLIHQRAAGEPEIASAITNQKQELEQKIAEALITLRGNLTRVAEEVGLESYQSVRYHIARSIYLTQVFNAARERVVDRAEDNVFDAVEDGNLNYSWKLLQTLGKDRGYTERREVDSHVVHETRNAKTSDLIGLLDQMASADPNLVEAQFSDLGDEERGLLAEALAEATPGEEENEL